MRDVTIVGGGLAGLTLAIALRQQEFPVSVFEAETYPRHRVCGEFISGKGLDCLRKLGLLPTLLKAGAREIKTVAFYSEQRCYMRRALPAPGLAMSRWSLDAALAAEFQRVGGDLIVGTKWESGYTGPGLVRATGRRRAIARVKPRWFGAKTHAHNVSMESDLEMHFLNAGYVGLCRLGDGTVNVCGMFSAGRNKGAVCDMLRGPANSILHERLRHAVWEQGSFCAVAGLPLTGRIDETSEARVGDAIAMVPPVTGNGMSFAFESAEIAAAAFRYGADSRQWDRLVGELRDDYRDRFARRLYWGNMFHQALLKSPVVALWFGCSSPAAWRLCFKLTR